MDIREVSEVSNMISRALELVDMELVPRFSGKKKPIIGSSEWYLTSAFAIANNEGLVPSDELLSLGRRLHIADCDVYLPDRLLDPSRP